VKVTEIVQVAPAATLLPQLLVCAKFEAPLPVMLIPVIFNAAFPEFESVTDCAALVVFTIWFAKVTAVAERTACGVGAVMPVPVAVKAFVSTAPVCESIQVSVIVAVYA